MNGFRKMQFALGKEGWFVGWNLPCCQTCAWDEVAFLDTVEDQSKVLFNHSQDCEYYGSEEECPYCEGEGWDEYDEEDCQHCRGTGYEDFGDDLVLENYDTSVSGFVCQSPEQQDSSLFCFDGSEEGVANLKAVLPIIEQCGCKVNWNETGDSRIDISWSNDVQS